ncbi:MGMT family protein [Candidatus Woesearchaeota archaeon]|nr:MGMT family protein [Candidatus Woesearchaeota archaeon]
METGDSSSFQHRVLALLTEIPHGKITTYQVIAHKLGTKAYRAVGNALHTNPDPDTYPCCKVVKSNGSLGGFAHGSKEKIRRLSREGIVVQEGKIVHFEARLWS